MAYSFLNKRLRAVIAIYCDVKLFWFVIICYVIIAEYNRWTIVWIYHLSFKFFILWCYHHIHFTCCSILVKILILIILFVTV